VIDLQQSKSQIVHARLPEDDPRRRQPVVEPAKKQLGWEPKVPLEEGLKKTIAYFSEDARVNNIL